MIEPQVLIFAFSASSTCPGWLLVARFESLSLVMPSEYT